MRTWTRLVVLALLVAAAGCGQKDAKWKASRNSYCSELSLVRENAAGYLNNVQETVNVMMPKKGPEHTCDVASAKLEQMAFYLDGFDLSTHFLARGRGDDETVPQAGFVLNTPSEPIHMGEISFDHECREGTVQKAMEIVSEMAKEVVKRIAEKEAMCSKVGWKGP